MTTTDASDQMRSNLDLIGRDNVNDTLEIYSLIGHEEPEGTHRVEDNCAAEFTWDYTKGARPKLDKLYEKAKGAQWNGRTDLPWETEVDQYRLAHDLYVENTSGPFGDLDMSGTAVAKWGEKEWVQFNVENQNWTLSQFMHGEQGALMCTAKIVETVPWIDAKYYAATQVVDEARHVEVFSRYLNDKCSGHYQVNGHLGLLLDDIIADSRWDMTYLGMQVMVEGLALAAFGFMHQLTPEPLLKKLLRYVMADEARHVAFGVLSLQEVYSQLSAAEVRERQEFAYEAAVRMRDRMAGQEVWDRLGVSPTEAVKIAAMDAQRNEFQGFLFAKIVPNCKKLGLLDAADGWLRTKFTEMGVIAFEDFEDTTLEIDQAADGSPAVRADL
ncbi:MAG TPA: ferritin-like domain-containing protein [Acidimicrobiales bacterium]|nr:ferritin-like domain-containing protein [Acidimicrobiales bacterium]